MVVNPRAFPAPRAMFERKARHGAPCTSCGLCCVATVCHVGRQLFGGDVRPCPALRMRDGKSSCDVIERPEHYTSAARVAQHGVDVLRQAAGTLIGSGVGCDARFNGELPDIGFYLSLARWDYVNADAIAAACTAWGIQHGNDGSPL